MTENLLPSHSVSEYMDLWELMLEVEDGNPLVKVSALYPGKAFIMWYLWARQLIKFSFDNLDELKDITDSLEKFQYKIIRTETTDNMALVLPESKFDGELDIWDISTSNNCLELPPATFEDGRGIFRIAGFDEKSISSFVSKVVSGAQVKILHKRRLPLNVLRSSLWTSSVLSSFSPRQAESLIKAQKMGYYNTPRRVTTSEVAKYMKLGRSTFEDHLRKAENILVNSFVPYLNLFNSNRGKDFHHQTLSNTPLEIK